MALLILNFREWSASRSDCLIFLSKRTRIPTKQDAPFVEGVNVGIVAKTKYLYPYQKPNLGCLASSLITVQC